MSSDQLVMIESLRHEIARFGAQQFGITVLVTIIAAGLYVVGHGERYRGCIRAIPVLIGSGLWAIGRADLLMHRAAGYMVRKGGAGAEWEAFKSQLASTHLLPLY